MSVQICPAEPIDPPYVYINIKEGKDLTDMDMMKEMDPYVKVLLGKTVKQTQIQKRSGRNPKFNEEFYFKYNGEQQIR